MARLRIEQILSNLSFSSGSLILSSSNGMPAIIISGSAQVVSTPTQTGSLSIQNIDSFGDSSSFYTLDLGDY
jgi:hypothetical protein